MTMAETRRRPVVKQEELRQKALSDGFVRYGLAVTALWVAVTAWLQAPLAIAAALVAASGFALAWLLRSYNYRKATNAIWMVTTSLGIFIGTFAAGTISEVQTIFFAMCAVPFLLFNLRTDRGLIAALALLPAVLWLVRLVIGDSSLISPQVDPVTARTLLAPIAALTSFGSILFTVAYFAFLSTRFGQYLESARKAAEQSSRAKTAFLSGISHEMRTPLNGVIGLADLLRHEAENKGDAKMGDYAAKIGEAGQSLLETVEKTVHFADLAGGRTPVAVQPVAVSDVLAEVLKAAQQAALNSGIHLSQARSDGVVMADRTLLSDALHRLVDNAIRYSGHGSSVIVGSELAESGRLRLFVADTGPGFARDADRRAFEPFERLDRATGTIFGAGLGLPIARIKSEAMGGTVTIDPDRPQGALVWIELPIAPQPAE